MSHNPTEFSDFPNPSDFPRHTVRHWIDIYRSRDPIMNAGLAMDRKAVSDGLIATTRLDRDIPDLINFAVRNVTTTQDDPQVTYIKYERSLTILLSRIYTPEYVQALRLANDLVNSPESGLSLDVYLPIEDMGAGQSYQGLIDFLHVYILDKVQHRYIPSSQGNPTGGEISLQELLTCLDYRAYIKGLLRDIYRTLSDVTFTDIYDELWSSGDRDIREAIQALDNIDLNSQIYHDYRDRYFAILRMMAERMSIVMGVTATPRSVMEIYRDILNDDAGVERAIETFLGPQWEGYFRRSIMQMYRDYYPTH